MYPDQQDIYSTRDKARAGRNGSLKAKLAAESAPNTKQAQGGGPGQRWGVWLSAHADPATPIPRTGCGRWRWALDGARDGHHAGPVDQRHAHSLS